MTQQTEIVTLIPHSQGYKRKLYKDHNTNNKIKAIPDNISDVIFGRVKK